MAAWGTECHDRERISPALSAKRPKDDPETPAMLTKSPRLLRPSAGSAPLRGGGGDKPVDAVIPSGSPGRQRPRRCLHRTTDSLRGGSPLICIGVAGEGFEPP